LLLVTSHVNFDTIALGTLCGSEKCV